ncbi:MAG: transcriptional regulator [Desulfuromonas sp.]|uniref:FmdB family zinc ribbon protein n=1 Tax=Desulfuromonas sp. TaxID=892 RepID=UPI000CC66B39|nr:zinc ribbon domain-containing protein [Desulfuromonas sp.]PLX84164.1 MAG: transcriptional regulator [Desulfuromonas sp.]
MPMYEYECQACGLVFEARQKFSDAPLSECGSCGGAVKKLISQTAFSLKGGGWYQQGYAEGAKPAACSSPGGAQGGCAGCPKAANE